MKRRLLFCGGIRRQLAREMQLHFLTLLVLLPATCSALQCYYCNGVPNLDYQWSCNYTRGEDTSVFKCKLSDQSNCILQEVASDEECWAWAYFSNTSFPLPSQASYESLINIVYQDVVDPAPKHCYRQFNESDFILIVQNLYQSFHLQPWCKCLSNLCNGELEFIIFHPSPVPSTTLDMLHVTPTIRPPMSDGGPDTVLTTMEPSRKDNQVHIAVYIIPPLLLAIVIVVVCIGAALLCWCNALHRQNSHSRSEFDFPKGGDVMLDLMDHPSAKRPMLSRGQMIQVQELSLSIVEMVGSGRFGTVWKAVDKKGRAVAVKVFGYKDEPSWRNERYFYRIPSTSHAHVLKYIASGRKGSDLSAQYYMVCHYCQYGSLSNYLQNHTVSWNVAMNIIRCIASALAHLHGDHWVNSSGEVVEKSPIAHRDVKSSNILLTSTQGDCVLSDFGLALELSTNLKQLELANSGQVGTYRYMAPEALDAHVNLSNTESFKQIDTYALALVTWEVMTVCQTEEVPASRYQLPFQDVVGQRPTLDAMRQAVVVNLRRPVIPDTWRSNKNFMAIAEAMEDCWDGDPGARLTVDTLHQRVVRMYTPNTNHPSPAESREQEDKNSYSTSSSPPLSEVGGVAEKDLI